MTRILKISSDSPEPKKIRIAAKTINEGKLVIFPTETVYGIGADAYNREACAEIYRVKGRPSDNPLMIHVSDMDMAMRIGKFPKRYVAAVEKLWPGPIAFVVNARRGLERKEVSIRMPANKVALALIRASGTPIAAPSANISKKPSSTNARHAMMYFKGKVAIIIDSGSSAKGIESTILDLRSFTIQRPGAFPIERIERAFGRRPRVSAESRGLKEASKAIAPGMKYRHYSPETPVFLYTGRIADLPRISSAIGKRMAFIGSEEACLAMRRAGAVVLPLGKRSDYDRIAHNLFDRLIKLDSAKVDFAIVEQFSEKGIGLGIMNRLRKATNHKSFSNRKELTALIERL